MKVINKAEKIPFPEVEITENFKFEAVTDKGTMGFSFKWFSSRWHCWVTLPSGEIRQASVYPNVVSWTGFSDFGLVFLSELPVIDYNSLFLSELVLLQWQ